MFPILLQSWFECFDIGRPYDSGTSRWVYALPKRAVFTTRGGWFLFGSILPSMILYVYNYIYNYIYIRDDHNPWTVKSLHQWDDPARKWSWTRRDVAWRWQPVSTRNQTMFGYTHIYMHIYIYVYMCVWHRSTQVLCIRYDFIPRRHSVALSECPWFPEDI